MKSLNRRIIIASFVFVTSITLNAIVLHWLVSESEAEHVRNIKVEYERLVRAGKYEEARELSEKSLDIKKPIHPYWLSLIRIQRSGYFRLSAMVQVLAFDPNREATYDEISNLIAFAPEQFQKEMKAEFLKDIYAIEGIREDYLRKSGLK